MRFDPNVVVLLAVLGPTVAAPAAAQMGGNPELHRNAMSKTGFLVGDWAGDGWFFTPNGRQDIQQSESVRFELGGTILVIEGTARERTGDVIGDVLFNAYAVISWSEAGGFVMRSYLWNGLTAERSISFTENGFSWGQETPGGPITYTMTLTPDGEWQETGLMDRGGSTFPVIEFNVRKTIAR